MFRLRYFAKQYPRQQRCATISVSPRCSHFLTFTLSRHPLAIHIIRPHQNFLALCASGYYDNTLWHRNIKGFMIQTGDPTGSGKGGQSLWGKPFSDEVRSTLKVCASFRIVSELPTPKLQCRACVFQFNNRGILAMANSGPDTNKSQFFVTYAKQPHLDGKYTIFGKVCFYRDTFVRMFQNSSIVCASHQHYRSLMARTQRWRQWSEYQ